MPGGYIGVDVFFVISGFLITGLLVREGERTGRIDLVGFYARRARRLLPAATLVLLLVGVLTPFFLPASEWQDTAIEVLSSVFYVENWRLAAQAVDYLAAENAPSAVQHYWSLSVEEQFYIFWPALIIAGLAAARALGASARTLLRALFVLVAAASLAASIWLTRTDPASAYFVTHTRIWELSLGGLLALGVPAFGEGTRRLLGFAGVAAILAAAFFFSTKTPFPGYAALLPTLGAALVILSGDSESRLSVFQLLKTRPFQFVGDVSYSIYLWHWPLIIFFQSDAGTAIGPVAGVIILIASVAIAALSKSEIEDRFRHPRPGQSLRRRAALFASFVVTPVMACGVVYAAIAQQEAALAAGAADYPGAESLSSGAKVPAVESFSPPLALLKSDKAAAYDNGCHLDFDQSEPVACRYGDPEGKYKVFLIGDSHAANWIPPLEKVAEQRGWNAVSYTKSSCPLIPVMLRRVGHPYEECLVWYRRIMQIIKDEKPDLVLLGQMYSLHTYSGTKGKKPPSVRESLVRLWRDIEALGPKVIAIADTPRWKKSPDACLAKDPKCSVYYKSIVRKDPLRDAHKRYPNVPLIDFKDIVCPDEKCPAVIGNVIVWRDRHHITATYSRSMADVFAKRVDDALGRGKEGKGEAAATN